MNIETTNEKEGLRELTEQVNQIIHPLQSAHQEPDTGSKQYRPYGDEYEQPRHVAEYGEESPTRAQSGGAKCLIAPPMRSTNHGYYRDIIPRSQEKKNQG